ncbi:MAG: phosphate/phosphite/phosphonate ABC transporter substrate-binding protein [Gammaproteobacteria bacterium]|nr:phosphate/phosphite/phosphonate ABC transporter substrate-binding protein [Gammaproteobacteria bacterium]
MCSRLPYQVLVNTLNTSTTHPYKIIQHHQMPYNKRLKSALCVFAMICLCQTPAIGKAEISGSKNKPKAMLTFGLLPIQSPITLFKRFAPLRDYISTTLNQRIRLETAKNFHEYAKRTAVRQYDILFTAPHMALAALDNGKYELAATFNKPLQAVIVAKTKSAIQQLSDLIGKTIATPPKQAITTLFGIQYIQAQNIRNVHFNTYRTHNAAYNAVLGNEAQAAIIANFIAINAIKHNKSLKIIAQSPSFPGIGILVAQDLSSDLKNRIKKTFWNMEAQPEGRAVLKKISQPGYTEAHRSEFEALRPFSAIK